VYLCNLLCDADTLAHAACLGYESLLHEICMNPASSWPLLRSAEFGFETEFGHVAIRIDPGCIRPRARPRAGQLPKFISSNHTIKMHLCETITCENDTRRSGTGVVPHTNSNPSKTTAHRTNTRVYALMHSKKYFLPCDSNHDALFRTINDTRSLCRHLR
jgi:hypothetical protein